MKMKKTTTCVVRARCAFARKSGRMSSADAPVVPMMLASAAPMARNATLTSGVPISAPRTRMPPEIANSEPSSAMNAT